ncbi:uncharacterized protein LOC132027118 [Mustela nigripes]|uniref:uncharacterized protein LOC132027118 n=1 Tax=Mustela nigripes TaxID=77151 RepID=UPI0028164FD6|nr:uncharacterized protein LOC132027118 [Mustela nigripes]
MEQTRPHEKPIHGLLTPFVEALLRAARDIPGGPAGQAHSGASPTGQGQQTKLCSPEAISACFPPSRSPSPLRALPPPGARRGRLRDPGAERPGNEARDAEPSPRPSECPHRPPATIGLRRRQLGRRPGHEAFWEAGRPRSRDVITGASFPVRKPGLPARSGWAVLEKATLEDDKQSSQHKREDGLAAAAVSVALSGRQKAEGSGLPLGPEDLREAAAVSAAASWVCRRTAEAIWRLLQLGGLKVSHMVLQRPSYHLRILPCRATEGGEAKRTLPGHKPWCHPC